MQKRKRPASEAVLPVQTARGCAVCAASDARLLVLMELAGGAAVTLCGSHALMLSRTEQAPRTVAEVRALLADRRASERRTMGEGDELGERLIAAFRRERRVVERRAG